MEMSKRWIVLYSSFLSPVSEAVITTFSYLFSCAAPQDESKFYIFCKNVLHYTEDHRSLSWPITQTFAKKKLFMIIWLVVSVHSLLLGNIIIFQAKPMLLKLSCNIYLIERCRIAYRFLVLATCADCRQAVSHKLIK